MDKASLIRRVGDKKVLLTLRPTDSDGSNTFDVTLGRYLASVSWTVSNTAVLNFEPIVVLGLAWIILGQSVAPRQIVGAFVVVGALILLSTGKR